MLISVGGCYRKIRQYAENWKRPAFSPPTPFMDLLLQLIISWTDFIEPYYKVHTVTHIPVFPQNSRHWPLCMSANVGIAAGNTAKRYLLKSPVRLPSGSDDLIGRLKSTHTSLFIEVGK
jgi:hypothetical protein